MQTPNSKGRAGNLDHLKSRTQGTFCQRFESSSQNLILWHKIEGIEGVSLSSNREQKNLLNQMIDAQIASLRNCSKIKQALLRQNQYAPCNKLFKNKRKIFTPFTKASRMMDRNMRVRNINRDMIKNKKSSVSLLNNATVKPKSINNCLEITNKKYFNRPKKKSSMFPDNTQCEPKGLDYHTSSIIPALFYKCSQSGRLSGNGKYRSNINNLPLNNEGSTMNSLTEPIRHNEIVKVNYLRQTVDDKMFCRKEDKINIDKLKEVELPLINKYKVYLVYDNSLLL